MATVRLLGCQSCGNLWSARLVIDQAIACPQCGADDAWEIRRHETSGTGMWDPWEHSQDYFNARAERMP